MRTITFNKVATIYKCAHCGKNDVEKWNKLCPECASKKQEQLKKLDLKPLGKRQPAAVFEHTENGNKVFVDKNGREVKDHGYNLEVDPRGWIRNGKQTKKAAMII